jgi:diguanylate cyclase (GGDEF)-like protein
LRQRVAGFDLRAGDVCLKLSISIGVTELHPADRDLDSLLFRADEALYDAKRAGRNRVAVREPAARPVPASGSLIPVRAGPEDVG